MSSTRPFDIGPHATPGGVADRRAAVLHQEEERAALRQKELEAQSSPLNDPQERIRIWERLHALGLPKAAGHKLVRVIAAQTALSVRQVQAEQQRRAGSADRLPAPELGP